MKRIECFHIGPQKTATTWIYRCLSEHPDIAAPLSDSIHYFDIHYHRGRDWLASHFAEDTDNQRLFDPTYTYIRSDQAIERIYHENPNAHIALTLRHPIARAFSHYWHEKKKNRFNYNFTELTKNFDLFDNWLTPGFYASRIRLLQNYFHMSQIFPLFYDELANAPMLFFRKLLQFYEVDAEFVPSLIGQRVNIARSRREQRRRFPANTWKQNSRIGPISEWLPAMSGGWHSGTARADSNREFITDLPTSFLGELIDICIPEIERLEQMFEVDLSHWRDIERLATL